MPGTALTRRTMLGAMAAAPFTGQARAQAAWPSRPVRVMVPYPPAGGADTTARIIYAKLGEDLGQPFAIENRGGAGGTIAEAMVAKADPDGYTILHDATAFSVNGSLYENLPFDYRKDFDPVFLVGLVANILVCTPSVPVKTVADVIAYAKASPDGIDMASSGNGTLQHLAARIVQAHRRHQDQSHPVSRRRAGDHRCHGGPGEICFLQRLLGGRVGQVRQGESDRTDRQGQARQPAGHSGHVRHAAGIRRLRLERRFRAARHAGARSCKNSMPASTRRWFRR